MTISLIIEDGSGVDNANSYANATYVDTYCENMGYSDWGSGGGDKSKSAILRGMSYIESKNYNGRSSSSSNTLEFPRIGLVDRNGYVISSSTIPDNLKKALCEASRREYIEPGILQQDYERGGRIKRKKTDVLETEYFQSSQITTTISIIDGLLKSLTIGVGTLKVRV